jgi:hypothetical protein
VADDMMRADIAAAWDRVTNKLGKKRDVRKLPEYLSSDEHVLAMGGGVTGGNNGLLVATNKRVLFVSEGVINHSFEDFPYDRITTVMTKRGMMFGKILITTAGVTRVIEQVDKGEAEAISAVIRERVDGTTRERAYQAPNTPTPQAAAPPSASPGHGIAAELRELADLRDQGILTEDEFAEQKRKLLGR